MKLFQTVTRGGEPVLFAAESLGDIASSRVRNNAKEIKIVQDKDGNLYRIQLLPDLTEHKGGETGGQ
jgi:hypothetical protein